MNMKKIDVKGIFNSFRVRILLSFLLLQSILILWIAVYFTIRYKERNLQTFSVQLADIQNQFLASNRFLLNFLISGHEQSSFYQTNEQADIDTFINSLKSDLIKIKELNSASKEYNIDLATSLDTLKYFNEMIIHHSYDLKKAYFRKGFKDFGLEGEMRNYAHFIEESTNISTISILQLRRHEKDYLIRGEKKYADKFDKIITELLASFPVSTIEHKYLLKYKSSFLKLVTLYTSLGIHGGSGMYQEIYTLIKNTDNQYSKVNQKAGAQIGLLQDNFKKLLIGISLFSLVISLFLTFILSKKLTKGISDLNKRMYAFIKSRFKNDGAENAYTSKITEIARLNKDFLLLKNTLNETLENLEDSYEKAQKASEHKGIFLANMSHEIRTPLNGIIGMAHILKSGNLTIEQKDHLETLQFSANHLLELINTILDYSKIEAGKMEIDAISFDLGDDLTKLVKIFEYKTIEKNLKLSLDYAADNTRYKIGDSIKLQQVLINLLNNAVKFTKDGEVKLIVKQLFLNDKIQTLRFEITDTGIGISEDKTENLFNAFEQGDASITRNYGGTGLGLNISNQLIKLLGSELSVKSKENVGSVFSFEIEFKVGELIKYEIQKDKIISPLKKKVNILLAEDNLINQKVLGMIIKQCNANLVIAKNGLEAYEFFIEQDFDMIFMDVQMPIMDGFQSAEKIRSHPKSNENYIPIIAITANAFSEDRDRAFEVGMDAFLSKPVKPLELKSVIEKYSRKQEV
jgi:signal transduction histidine kinase/CheY-like chemotaxis protein